MFKIRIKVYIYISKGNNVLINLFKISDLPFSGFSDTLLEKTTNLDNPCPLLSDLGGLLQFIYLITAHHCQHVIVLLMVPNLFSSQCHPDVASKNSSMYLRRINKFLMFYNGGQ